MHCVYWLHLPEHTDIFSEGYIGVTTRSRLAKRYDEHRRIDNNTRHENLHLSRAFKKYSDRLMISSLIIGSPEYCFSIEKRLRPSKNIGWNVNIGGDRPPIQYGPKPHVSRRLREQVGPKHPMFGKKQSSESNEKRSIALKNSGHRVHVEGHTKETRLKMSLRCPKNSLGKKWYHDPLTKKATFYKPGQQPRGWLEGRK